jgi:hypothetical protein
MPHPLIIFELHRKWKPLASTISQLRITLMSISLNNAY